MEVSTAFLPSEVFAPDPESRPRVFLAPQRYIQGSGVLGGMGRYLSLVRATRVAVLITQGGRRRHGDVLTTSLRDASIEPVVGIFGGECSAEEVGEHVAAWRGKGIDCVLTVGGGKCIDAGKAIAYRLDVPVAVAPTLASNDAPCSALSVLYTPAGVSSGVEFYPCSPAMVVVDTAIVAAAPERMLVAGMGDAMATWYEAAVCLRNPAAMTTVGARPTLASAAIGETCAAALFREGEAAARAVAAGVANAALETVVEANTLLSGLGFESGGLAAAHAFAQAFPALPRTHHAHLHGEMVAMGTLAQLVMEDRAEEARRVAEFFAKVGLPVHLGQLSVDVGDAEALEVVVEGALGFPFLGNMPMPVDGRLVRAALLGAHELGTAVAGQSGDAAFRRLHGR
jgi:glycerol dehydrogenase